MMSTRRMFTKAILSSLTLTLLMAFPFGICAGDDIKDVMLAKAKDQLIARLENTHPELAEHLANIDAEKWGRYAGEISAGNARAVFEEILQEKRTEMMDDLYEKGKEYAISKGVLGEETEKYIGWVESYGSDALAMAEKAYNGDYRGAGDIVINRMKEELQAKAADYLTGKATDAIDFFLKDIVGQSVGAIYLKIIELEIAGIEEFQRYTTEYFGTFQVTLPDGKKEERTWCTHYTAMRNLGHDPYSAFYNQDDRSGAHSAIADLVILPGLWYSTSRGELRAVERPDEQTMRKELELCYIRSKLPGRAALQSLVDRARNYADRTLFKEVKEGMEKRKREIIIIIDGTKIPTTFSLVVTVADKDTGQGIPGSTVIVDGDRKDAPGGAAVYPRPLTMLDQDKSGQSINVSAEASGYDSKTVSFTIGLLANSFQRETEEVRVRLSLSPKKKPPEDFTVEVIVTDKKTGNRIPGAKTTLDGETKDAPDGVASYARKSSMLDPANTGNAVGLSAEAGGYKSATASYTIGELAAKLDQEKKRIGLTLSLEPEEKRGEEIDRFEVRCDLREISEDEISSCGARIYFKSGKTRDVSDKAKWTPGFVESSEGKVKGREVAALHPLPHTVTAEATYDAPSEEGGKSWVASETVLVKPVPGKMQGKIKIQKVPDAQHVKPGEWVIYTYSVANTGESELTSVKVADDQCSPVKYLEGDTNGNNILDLKETWIYECSASLNRTTENKATVEAYSPSRSKVTDQATAKVTVGPCPPGKVQVPYLLYMTQNEATSELQQNQLVVGSISQEYSVYVNAGTVMAQEPQDGDCVDPYTVINLVISKGRKPEEPPETTPSRLTAEFDCGPSFELAPGDFLGRSCGVIVRGWKSNTENRVRVRVDYNKNSGIEIFPEDTSAPPSLMYTAGIQDTWDRYIFSESFRAKENAPPGITDVTITVSQEGMGQVTFNVKVAVLAKGLLPGSGAGIRPPAEVKQGTGGPYCVWRYKLFGDPPECFHTAVAACGTYANQEGYELIGQNMTWGEAGTRSAEISRYFQNQYGCDPFRSPKDTDGDGVPDDKDKCPGTPAGQRVDGSGCGDSQRDSDGDGVTDDRDKCPGTYGEAVDGNGCGPSQKDSDGDGVMDDRDRCPSTPPGERVDGNGCSASQRSSLPAADSDGDGVPDDKDYCPNTPRGQGVDGYGCAQSQRDTDQDGVSDDRDRCPGTAPGERVDGNGCSASQRSRLPAADSDGDGVPDDRDWCQGTPRGQAVNAYGCAASQIDSDQDGVTDDRDRCPGTPRGERVDGNGCSASQRSSLPAADSDGDGVPDDRDWCQGTPRGQAVNAYGCAASQIDSDQDGVTDDRDRCPGTPRGERVDAYGCSASQRSSLPGADSDGDGVPDGRDWCQGTPRGQAVNAYGCAASQIDSDQDGVTDDRDRCPGTPRGERVDGNGCSASQRSSLPVVDSDGDGVPDDRDYCPNTPRGQAVNTYGCAANQRDTDQDGVTDDRDRCPGTPRGERVDASGCPQRTAAKPGGQPVPPGKVTPPREKPASTGPEYYAVRVGDGILSVRTGAAIDKGIPRKSFRHGGTSSDPAPIVKIGGPFKTAKEATQVIKGMIQPGSLRKPPLAAGTVATAGGKTVTIDDWGSVDFEELHR